MPSIVTCDQIIALTELRHSNVKLTLFEAHFHVLTWKSRFNLSRSASWKAL